MGRLLRLFSLFLHEQYAAVGGQAVIEGVMMRSPNSFVVAVRRADGSIHLRKDQWFGLSKRFAFFKKPFLRGILVLFESMANGIVSLNYSANLAMEDEEKKKQGQIPGKKQQDKVGAATFLTILVSFLFAIGLFVFLPHALTALIGQGLGQEWSLNGPQFHAVDGIIKSLVFVLYIFIIGLFPDIRKVFQYHGAEHKSIATFEAGEELTVANASKFSTLHPRCGTTFVFFLLFISIIFFTLVFTVIPVQSIFPLETLAPQGSRFLALNIGDWQFAGFDKYKMFYHFFAIVLKVLLVAPLAGLSYEILKFSGSRQKNPICRGLSFPGMLLQKLTTREPDAAQLEVALASLKTVLFLEEKFMLKEASGRVMTLSEVKITSLADIEDSGAKLKDFLE